MGETRTETVLVVDTDASARDRVVDALQRVGYAVRSFDNGSDALALAAEKTPALVLAELNLPDTSGYELCRVLRETHGNALPVFLMSGERTEPMDRVAGLMIGADDFILKPLELEELVARVRRTLERSRNGHYGRVNLEVTPREFDVLVLLADGNGQQQIAEMLGISPKTVATHIQHLLVKFGVHSRAQLVALAYKGGMLDRE